MVCFVGIWDTRQLHCHNGRTSQFYDKSFFTRRHMRGLVVGKSVGDTTRRVQEKMLLLSLSEE